MNKTTILKKCLIGILFLVAGGIYLGTSSTKADGLDKNLTVHEFKEETSELSKVESEEEPSATPEPIEEPKTIVVHVCGCVTQPDVYELQENARLIDAVKAAHGFTNEAATDEINQAQLLNDGQRIYIPSKEEIEEGLTLEECTTTNSDSKENQRINLNLATKEELMTLPGIGETKADRILAYRKEHGGFQTIEDIKQIAGVKEATFSEVKDLITIE